MRTGMGFLAGLCLLFGLVPQLLSNWVVIPAAWALGFDPTGGPSWLGIHILPGGVPPVAGALILLAALLVAGLVFAVSQMGRASRTVNMFTGGDPVPPGDNAGAEDFAGLAQSTLEPVYTYTNPDPLYLLVWRAVQGFAGLFARGVTRIEGRPLLASLIMAGLVIAAVWLF